jgi:hypothetical protein
LVLEDELPLVEEVFFALDVELFFDAAVLLAAVLAFFLVVVAPFASVSAAFFLGRVTEIFPIWIFVYL